MPGDKPVEGGSGAADGVEVGDVEAIVVGEVDMVGEDVEDAKTIPSGGFAVGILEFGNIAEGRLVEGSPPCLLSTRCIATCDSVGPTCREENVKKRGNNEDFGGTGNISTDRREIHGRCCQGFNKPWSSIASRVIDEPGCGCRLWQLMSCRFLCSHPFLAFQYC